MKMLFALVDLSLFLELEEKLGLFRKITLCFLCPAGFRKPAGLAKAASPALQEGTWSRISQEAE